MVTTIDSLTVEIGADVKPFEASLGILSSNLDGVDTKLEALNKKFSSISTQSSALAGRVSAAGATAFPAPLNSPDTKGQARFRIQQIDAIKELAGNDASAIEEIIKGAVEGGIAAGVTAAFTGVGVIPAAAIGALGGALAAAVTEALEAVLDPELEDQLSSVLADLERAEKKVADINTKLFELRTEQRRGSDTDPIDRFRIGSQISNLEAELTRNKGELEDAQAELQSLVDEANAGLNLLFPQGHANPGVGAMNDTAAAVDGLSEKLSVDLTAAMQAVNVKWPEFSRIAIENLDKVEQKAGSLANTLNSLPGSVGGGSATCCETKAPGEKALGGPVFPGGTFLVGERGPELFVPSTAGTIIPNSALSGFGGSGGGGGDLGAGIARLTAELQRLVAVLQQASAGQARLAAFSAMSSQSFAGLQGVLAQTQGGFAATGTQAAQLGTVIDEALGHLPEEFGFIAEAIEGPLNEALSGNIRSWEDLREAALGAAQEVLGGILQSEEVRAEIGELADVIDGVLNQALNGSIDSWEDLGRVALDVLQQIATEILKTQLAGQGGGGGIFGAIGSFLGIVGGIFGGGGGGAGVADPGSGAIGGGAGGFKFSSQPGLSGGGLVSGPGSGTSDSIPARLSNGEFVVNAIASREHRGLLQAINSGAVPTLNDPGFLGTPVQPAGRSTTVNISIDARGAERGVGEEIAQALVARIDKLDREIEPRAAAEVIRRANRGGDFARGIGRRP